MAKLYERYLRLLQTWPVNAEFAPPLRALPEYLRQQGKVAFSARGEFTGDAQKCDRRLKSLETISRNHWASSFPHTRQSGALGLTAEQCRYALSAEYHDICESSRISQTVQGLVGSLRTVKKEKI